MPTTEEAWDIDGVSLSELGWNVSTLAGRFNAPALRGEDNTYAYVEGQDFRPKTPDARSLTLNMWVSAAESDGTMATDPILRWNENWHFLTTLFWTPRRQVTITRRWRRTDPVTGNTITQVTTAKGQYQSGLEPTMTGRFRSTFTIELKLTDPFFYGEEIATTLPLGEETVIVNPGDYTAAGHHMYVEFHGWLRNPVLTNVTPVPDVVVAYNAEMDTEQTLTLDIRQFGAVITPVIGSTNRVGFIRHSGTRYWFGLERGNNLVTLTAGAGDGHAVVRFRPPYL